MTIKQIGKKKPKCRVCKTEYTRERVGQVVCSVKCGIEKARLDADKKREKARLDKKRERIATKKKFNENDKKYVEKRARAYLHRWIKWRDRDLPCCACGNSMNHLPSRAIQASHYRPSGINSAVRYDELNIHLGCSRCNMELSGNLTEYRIRLIDKIGVEKVEWLETQNQVRRWSIDELREIRDDYAKRLKDLGIPLPSVR